MSAISHIQTIPFKKDGYDPFLNFLKAYSIVCVILAHTIPHKAFDYIQFMIWGDMQVPMFILIQTFHSYKSGKQPSFSIKKVWGRIMLPFLIVQIAIFILLLIFSSSSLETIIHDTWVSGGNGPGSYYVWVYLQIAFLLPLLYPLFNRFPRKFLFLVFIIACVLFDCLFSIICLPQPIYRLLSVRYVFLVYLGMIWVQMGGGCPKT